MNRRLASLHSTRWQKFCAWMLLLVYVPMVVLSSIHVHRLPNIVQALDCDLCATSVHHSGHISQDSATHGECLTCRFLNTPSVTPDECDYAIFLPVTDTAVACLPTVAVMRRVGHPSLRAPPIVSVIFTVC